MIGELLIVSSVLFICFIAVLVFVMHFGINHRKQLNETDRKLNVMNQDLSFIKDLYKNDLKEIINILKNKT